MADTIYTRTYAYQPAGSACQPGTSPTLIPISSLVVAGGDTEHAITSIKSITVSTRIRRYNEGGSDTEGWVCGLIFANINPIYAPIVTADHVSMSSARAVSTTFEITGQLKLEDITAISSMPTGVRSKNANVATQFGVYPLTVSISYTSAQFYPAISAFDAVRADEDGTRNPRGLYCLVSFRYEIGKLAQESVPASLTISDGTRIQTIYSTQSNVESNRDTDFSFVFSPPGGGGIAGGGIYPMTISLIYGQETATAQRIVGKTSAPCCYNNNCFSVGQFTSVPTDYDGDGIFESDWTGHFYNGIAGVNVYEPGEIDTGGKWVDGSPIYRRMVTFSASVGRNQIASISGSAIVLNGIDTVVKIDGMALWSSGANVPLNFYGGNDQYTAIWLYGTNGKNIYYSTSDACQITAVLYYTKETS